MKTRILSTVLALIMILGTLLLTGCGKKGFDYANEELSGYISYKSADYKNLPIELTTDVTDYAVTTEVSDRFKELAEKDESIFVTDKAIADNDLVKLYYRGMTLDAEGNETAFEGGSNLGDDLSCFIQ